MIFYHPGEESEGRRVTGDAMNSKLVRLGVKGAPQVWAWRDGKRGVREVCAGVVVSKCASYLPNFYCFRVHAGRGRRDIALSG